MLSVAGILRQEDLPRDVIDLLGHSHAERINTMVCDMIDYNWWATGEGTPPDPPVISMSPAILEATNALREFMFRHVYHDSPAKEDDHKIHFVIDQLYRHFVSYPEDIPADLRSIVERRGGVDGAGSRRLYRRYD
ncbi:MAG: hypothetical protein KatS3mg057_0686 [Herpetosiphonaceae bacterium]|nr:MAG: hypothetical protein KatS3mg057_0686 [Herpetosiphonaceae bacterium]